MKASRGATLELCSRCRLPSIHDPACPLPARPTPPIQRPQMMRFYYKADVQQKAKILRKVCALGTWRVACVCVMCRRAAAVVHACRATAAGQTVRCFPHTFSI